FVRDEICTPTSNPLDTISNKTLARHLAALLHGKNDVHCSRSASRRKATKNSPIKGKFMPWGIGDAARAGEWKDALEATQRITEANEWRVGQTLAHFTNLLHTPSPSNRLVTALVRWLLDNELRWDLKDHLLVRCFNGPVRDIPTHWFNTAWRMLNIDQDKLKKEALHLCEGNQDKADELISQLW
ncbi:MAG TPA: hypothetical protein VFO38_00215, partial [Candidatus Saccharimonadales bacterium]|nr:hypothetical protein [Candidatus Saccharimonadales bacterium]